jgi:hypothetical protein
MKSAAPQGMTAKSKRTIHASVAFPIVRAASNISESDIRRVYASIRRFFARHTLRSHRRCISRVRAERSLRSGVRPCSVCSYAHALLLWEQSWERTYRDIIVFHVRSNKELKLPLDSFYPSLDPHLSYSANLHLFALRCVSSFEYCLLLMQRVKGHDLFRDSSLECSERYTPYWLLSESAKTAVLHWWRRYTSVFELRSKLPTFSCHKHGCGRCKNVCVNDLIQLCDRQLPPSPTERTKETLKHS